MRVAEARRPTREDHHECDARWCQITVNVRADGEGLVSHAGSALLAQVADKAGLTRALSFALDEPGLRVGSHDRGRVIRDLAVMLADGGDCLADLRAVGDQAVLFGSTASPLTAFRVIDRIAFTPGLPAIRSITRNAVDGDAVDPNNTA